MNMRSFFFTMLLAFSVVHFSSADWFGAWEGQGLDITFPQGQVVNEIRFSSYGLPVLPHNAHPRNGKHSGKHWGLRHSKARTSRCHAWNTFLVVHQMCMNNEYCHIEAENFVFGDPCYGKLKYLAVQVVCGRPNLSQGCLPTPRDSSVSCGLNQPSRLIAAKYCSPNSVPHGLYISSGHSIPSLWSGGIDWVSAGFVEKSNGEAEISGVLSNSRYRWHMFVSLSGRQSSEAGLTPLKQNQGRCGGFNSDAWYFYRSLSGYLVNTDTGERFEISMNPKHPAQVGKFANLKNGHQGISFWMFLKDSSGKVAKADLNSDIICGLSPNPHRKI